MEQQGSQKKGHIECTVSLQEKKKSSSEVDTFHIVDVVKTHACNQKLWTNPISLVAPNYGFIVVHPFEMAMFSSS